MAGKHFGVCCTILLMVFFTVCYGDNNSTNQECPKFRCKTPCSYGNVLDKNGCRTCQCNPEPRQLKPVPAHYQECPVCSEFCRYGRQLGSNGCLSCECRKEPMKFEGDPIYGRPLIRPSTYQQRSLCSPLLCKNYCDFGRMLDENGCDTCRCNPDPSVQAPAPVGRQFPCPPLRCRNFCFSGRLQDNNGCETCRCNTRTEAAGREGNFNQLRNVRRPVQVRCPQLRCANFCRSGYRAVDNQGCPTCNCRESFFFRG